VALGAHRLGHFDPLAGRQSDHAAFANPPNAFPVGRGAVHLVASECHSLDHRGSGTGDCDGGIEVKLSSGQCGVAAGGRHTEACGKVIVVTTGKTVPPAENDPARQDKCANYGAAGEFFSCLRFPSELPFEHAIVKNGAVFSTRPIRSEQFTLITSS